MKIQTLHVKKKRKKERRKKRKEGKERWREG